MIQRELDHLSSDDCLDLLARHTIGRLVYNDEYGPVAEPVNYALDGDSIVIRVAGGRKRHAMTEPHVAFEVDQIDTEDKSGWSVVARGRGEEVDLDDVTALIHDMHQRGMNVPLPWASGVHNVWLRIRIESLSGRHLGSDASPLVF